MTQTMHVDLARKVVLVKASQERKQMRPFSSLELACKRVQNTEKVEIALHGRDSRNKLTFALAIVCFLGFQFALARKCCI